MISVTHKGDYSKVTRYLQRIRRHHILEVLDKYGVAGVDALSAATPVDTGLTANSWHYEIEKDSKNSTAKIAFYNTNVNKGIPIAILLNFGHATRNGGWVEGLHYIDPAIQPVFKQLAKDAWGEVSKI